MRIIVKAVTGILTNRTVHIHGYAPYVNNRSLIFAWSLDVRCFPSEPVGRSRTDSRSLVRNEQVRHAWVDAALSQALSVAQVSPYAGKARYVGAATLTKAGHRTATAQAQWGHRSTMLIYQSRGGTRTRPQPTRSALRVGFETDE